MKKRSKGFLAEELILHESEPFNYISELHDYLWRFVRTVLPGASGRRCKYPDVAIEQAERIPAHDRLNPPETENV